MNRPDPLRRLIQAAADLALSLDPDTAAAFNAFEGRSLRVAGREPALDIGLRFTAGRVEIVEPSSLTADATLRGRYADILSLRNRRDALYTGDVEIEGDLGFAQQLADVLGQARLDVVEPLARAIGDGPATHVGDAAARVGVWATRSADTVRQSLAEYLRDDARLLVARTELDTRFEAIEALRSDVDRLEARLARLERTDGG